MLSGPTERDQCGDPPSRKFEKGGESIREGARHICRQPTSRSIAPCRQSASSIPFVLKQLNTVVWTIPFKYPRQMSAKSFWLQYNLVVLQTSSTMQFGVEAYGRSMK